MPKRKLSYYEPGRNEPCLCGSGLKFKKCCQGRYSKDASKESLVLYNTGHYEEALKYSRRHLTWYILCHKAHTIPLLKANILQGEELLKVDIEALAELLADLHRCYYRTNRIEQFPATIDRLSVAVADKRWSDKINYFYALWHLIDKRDRENAFKALAPVEIERCYDPEILTLYLDVCPDKLGFAEKIALIDRIIDNAQKESYRLQYTTLKGIQYCLVCEVNEGLEVIKQGVDRYRELERNNKSPYGETHFAYALDLLGRFSNNKQLLEEAAEKYINLVAVAVENSYPPEYHGDLLKCLGECYEALDKHESAIEKFEDSLRTYPTDITKVFIARSIIAIGNTEGAREVLNSINYRGFDEAGFFDFAISWTLLAANTCTESDLEKAKQLLKQSKNDYPIFIQQRDKWLISLLEIDPFKKVGTVRKLIKSINKYVTLNPNICGIGIDLNKIVEDIDRSSNRK